MRIIITGAAGYVGSFLAQRLIKMRNECLLLDNYYVPSHIIDIEGVKIEKRDIREKMDLSGYDILVHLAAISGINKCNDNQQLAEDVNINGTINLLRTFKGKTVFASTSAVYGEATLPIINEGHPTGPLGVYGATKLSSEELIKETEKFSILRFTNIYGKGITWKRTVTDNFIQCALEDKPITIHGDGKQRRDFVNINDTIMAYWLAIRNDIYGIYNIGGNEALSVNEIATLVTKAWKKKTGKDVEINRIVAKSGREWKHFIYSSNQARMMLDYDPVYSVGDEIKERLQKVN